MMDSGQSAGAKPRDAGSSSGAEIREGGIPWLLDYGPSGSDRRICTDKHRCRQLCFRRVRNRDALSDPSVDKCFGLKSTAALKRLRSSTTSYFPGLSMRRSVLLRFSERNRAWSGVRVWHSFDVARILRGECPCSIKRMWSRSSLRLQFVYFLSTLGAKPMLNSQEIW